MESNIDSDTTSAGDLSEARKIEELPPNNYPTFTSQAALQRSPSTVKEHISALSNRLSTRSNDSHDSTKPSAIGILSPIPQVEVNHCENTRSDSEASITEATCKCSLSKSNSQRSTQSSKSVRSIAAVGHHPLGTLRVHSPSPTRRPNSEHHECLKSGDVIVVRDVPKGSLIGFDTVCLIVPDQFDGVKDIPAGAHFIVSLHLIHSLVFDVKKIILTVSTFSGVAQMQPHFGMVFG